MKKSLVALAALAAVGAASAQSTVTLSGLYTFSYQQDLTSANTITGNSATSGVVPGKGWAVTDANFKLAAVEDLGGGLSASFDALFETGAQRGAAVTRADSGIGLASAKLGSFAIRNTRTSDLISTIGSSAISLADGLYDKSGIVTRGSVDTVSYTTPAIAGGLRASLTYFEGNDGNQELPVASRRAYVVGASYAAGPLSLAAAYKAKAKNAPAGSKSSLELAATYNLGFATVAYAYDGKTNGNATPATAEQFNKAAHGVSATVPFGAFSAGLNYFKRGDAKITEAGLRYDLSKRTNIIASVGKKSGLADVSGNYGYLGNQYRLRFGHSF